MCSENSDLPGLRPRTQRCQMCCDLMLEELLRETCTMES